MAEQTVEQIYAEQFRSGGELPIGPISPWPQGRDISTLEELHVRRNGGGEKEIKAGVAQMAAGLIKTAGSAIRNGKVSDQIRHERFSTCLACPHFVHESSRCSLCGCYMKAKSWVDGPPKQLCPAKKWDR